VIAVRVIDASFVMDVWIVEIAMMGLICKIADELVSRFFVMIV